MATKNSVSKYTKTIATIYFPDDEVRCDLCPLLETYSRKKCRMTSEYLADGYLRGGMCPLIIESEENE